MVSLHYATTPTAPSPLPPPSTPLLLFIPFFVLICYLDLGPLTEDIGPPPFTTEIRPIHCSYSLLLFTAYSLPIHCLFTACSLPIHCLFTAYSLPIHCLFTAYSLPIHCLFTACSLPIHCLFTAYSLPIHVPLPFFYHFPSPRSLQQSVNGTCVTLGTGPPSQSLVISPSNGGHLI
jgi:hypothetical protein